MSAIPTSVIPASAPEAALPAVSVPMSPNQRAWARFKRNRLGYFSLWIFSVLLLLASVAELVSNDRPLVARYNGEFVFPMVHNPPETRFGGDFGTPTDWKDPLIRAQFAKPGNWAVFTFNEHSDRSQDYFLKSPAPSGSTATLIAPSQG